MVSHRMHGRKFGRKTKHRIALKRNLISALLEHGRIVTTLTKAKEYRPTPTCLGIGSSGRDDVSSRAGVGRTEPR